MTTEIILNGRARKICSPHLSYEAIRALAGYGPETVISVTWTNLSGGAGTLTAGDVVGVTAGLIINAHNTSKG